MSSWRILRVWDSIVLKLQKSTLNMAGELLPSSVYYKLLSRKANVGVGKDRLLMIANLIEDLWFKLQAFNHSKCALKYLLQWRTFAVFAGMTTPALCIAYDMRIVERPFQRSELTGFCLADPGNLFSLARQNGSSTSVSMVLAIHTLMDLLSLCKSPTMALDSITYGAKVWVIQITTAACINHYLNDWDAGLPKIPHSPSEWHSAAVWSHSLQG